MVVVVPVLAFLATKEINCDFPCVGGGGGDGSFGLGRLGIRTSSGGTTTLGREGFLSLLILLLTGRVASHRGWVFCSAVQSA